MLRLLCVKSLLLIAFASAATAADPAWRCETKDDRLLISLGDVPVAEYVFADRVTLRPYFCGVRTVSGTMATRAHPPRSGEDPTDHADMHPGVWLGFGDLNGADFWRNKAVVEHVRFVEEPEVGGDTIRFTVENRYLDGERRIATETCQHALVARAGGYWIEYDSTFVGPEGLAFGDQEEMGLGVRVASPLRVTGGNGEIVDSEGRRNEREIWGKSAPWCDYRGKIDGQTVGIAVFSHPENFRASWLHVRDYGLVVANPFGRKALTGGEASRLEIAAEEPIRLRFGVFIHSSKGEPTDLPAAYRDYCKAAK